MTGGQATAKMECTPERLQTKQKAEGLKTSELEKKREIRQGAKRETMKAIRGRGGGWGVQNETEQSDIDERGN